MKEAIIARRRDCSSETYRECRQVTVIEQFDNQVQMSPDSVAVIFEQRELTYQQLNELADRFAAELQNVGIQRGQTIGLCLDRCPEAIASMLAAFKIGAVYVPLDPEYPADRVRYMIDDAEIRAIITHDLPKNSLASQLFDSYQSDPGVSRDLQWIDCASETFALHPVAFQYDYPAADDLAYIMYTSGSTGVPKGVQIEHRSLGLYCDADREIYQLTSDDRTLQFSTLNFDIAIEEIFPPLLTGGVVVIRPQQRSASNNELSSIVDRYSVTAVHLATAYWHEWVDLMIASQTSVPASLRLVIATGEKVSVEHYRRWRTLCHHPVMWCNAYGPTETTVTATVFIPNETFDDEHMPIGKPLQGYEAWILDDHLRPLSVGETGQLFISGAALARGYHNNPEKTNAAFLTADLPHRGMTRIYRTGDLARWLKSGDIEYAGRVDHQIKIGSYRIEPGEIEVAIAKFPGVLESLVIHDEINSQKHLIAYVATGNNRVDAKSLQSYLRTVLPAYMVPPRYFMLESLPKTINGKIDRKSLPPASMSLAAMDSMSIEAMSETELMMAEAWRTVLNCDDIGINDDFFALGGSSLLVTKVVAAVATRYGIELPVRDFFANPTISSIAAHIDRLVSRNLGSESSSSQNSAAIEMHHERLPLVHAKMIPSHDGHLFSVRYQPRTNSIAHAVLMCNSIGHEQTRAGRNLQQLAVQLADQGFDVLRFDYRGTGNSTKLCSEVTAATMIEDAQIAATYLFDSALPERFSALGIRLGATILTNAKISFVNDLIVWDPVIEGSRFMEMMDCFHRTALSNQTRFSKVMKPTTSDQSYGHAMCEVKRNSINQLRLEHQPMLQCNRIMICSNGYRQHESLKAILFDSWNIETTQDCIYWHDLEFAERAFASPGAYQAIFRWLQTSRQLASMEVSSVRNNEPFVGNQEAAR